MLERQYVIHLIREKCERKNNIYSMCSLQGGGAENSTQGCGKFHPGFWKIPPRVWVPPRLLKNPTQGFEKSAQTQLGFSHRNL